MTAAILAAKSAGAFLKKHFYDQKKVDEASQNDIKLELDKLSQKLITEEILSVFPTHAVWARKGIPETATVNMNGLWTLLTGR